MLEYHELFDAGGSFGSEAGVVGGRGEGEGSESGGGGGGGQGADRIDGGSPTCVVELAERLARGDPELEGWVTRSTVSLSEAFDGRAVRRWDPEAFVELCAATESAIGEGTATTRGAQRREAFCRDLITMEWAMLLRYACGAAGYSTSASEGARYF